MLKINLELLNKYMLLDEFKLYVYLRDKKDLIFKPIVDIIPSWLSPNIITSIRFVLVLPLFLIWYYWATNPYFVWQESTWYFVGFIILLGLFTDYLDGAVARLTDRITVFGIYFDPITDKLFTIPVFLIFIAHWPIVTTSLYFLINLRILLILLGLVRAVLHKKERLSRLLQYGYITVTLIGYIIFAIKFVYDFL